METEESVQRRQQAVEEFNQQQRRGDGARVAGSLAGGLTLLRDLLYVRLHDDVERRVGMDSMLSPVSLEKAATTTKAEIDLFQAAVSAATVRQQGYVASGDDWYLSWLARFRLGRLAEEPRAVKRLSSYLSATPDKRRLLFTNVMARRWPSPAARLWCSSVSFPMPCRSSRPWPSRITCCPTPGESNRSTCCPRSAIVTTAAASCWTTAKNAASAAIPSGNSIG